MEPPRYVRTTDVDTLDRGCPVTPYMHVEDDAFSENDTVIDEDPPNAMWKPDGAEATAPKVSEEYRMWRMVANNRRGEAYMGVPSLPGIFTSLTAGVPLQ